MSKSVAKDESASIEPRWPSGSPRPALKSLAKQSFAAVAAKLPSGIRRVMLEALARAGAYEAFQALGRAYGVEYARVMGEYGLIEGSINDTVILPFYARTKSWSPARNRFFSEFFEKHHGGTYLDIGANLGLTTIPVAQNAAVSCKAFEPEPANFRHLRRNIESNCPHGNVELFNFALFDESGLLDFELSNSNMGDHRVRLREGDGSFGESQWPVIKIRAERLDDVLGDQSLKPPVAAKIIAQGAESHIIAGGAKVLAGAAAMVFEFYPYGLDRMAGDVEFLIDFITEYFDSGDMLIGNEQKPPTRQPICAVAGKMRRLATAGEATAYDYYHVFVRK